MPDYTVRLVMRVTADDGADAVRAMVDHMVANGLTKWIYRSEDPDTGEVLGYFDGNGNVVDIDEEKSAFDDQAPTQAELDQEQTPVQTDDEPPGSSGAAETDAELLTLAQDLNEGDAPSQPAE